MAGNQEMSLLEKKVAEQIEYYFGDHNLPRDKFLKEQLQLDDGWVTLETMLKCNRKSSFHKMHFEDIKLKGSYDARLKHKSVYMKGFPLETTLDEIKEWFADKGTVENIYLRKGAQKTFKGSIFAVLESEEAAKALVARTDVKEYKGKEMIVMMKDDYFSKKVAERKQNRVEAKAKAKSEKEDKQKQAEDEELGTILFHSNAQEALQKVREAKGEEDPKVKEQVVQWEALEGDVEMETLKKIMEDQQESMNKRKGGRGGHRGRGRGRGGRRDRGGREQTQFKGKKTKFDSDEEGDEEQASPKKRPLESNGQDNEEPASKQAKSENGS
ncbi:lupus La protein-like [Sinocyclocheilus rhinocerous]|uniref:lupus La protein-like n=1 Tax=Sinocyclocheilus rhinocerous TaxID=307959 RepID=UPI0007B9C6A4|nr:PREDICTED: lupus La protein-like [Sinocyclocheilus rhinocerous]